MTAPQLRHLTLTVLPWTFSSETLYLVLQDPQIIFIVFGLARCRPNRFRVEPAVLGGQSRSTFPEVSHP